MQGDAALNTLQVRCWGVGRGVWCGVADNELEKNRRLLYVQDTERKNYSLQSAQFTQTIESRPKSRVDPLPPPATTRRCPFEINPSHTLDQSSPGLADLR